VAAVPALERVTATRYVTPLREGGSLPGLVEADDDGIYVLKFRGAGQGVKVLVAEVLVTEIARLLGIAVPRLALVTLDEQIARYEADEEVQDLLNASIGLNLGVDFLPGSFGYDGSVPPPEDAAARIVWLDALTANVDRTWNNPNLLLWHRRTWAIDHGAALYFHHAWNGALTDPASLPVERWAEQPWSADDHVLRAHVDEVSGVADELAALITDDVIERVTAAVPDEWLAGPVRPDELRAAYRAFLRARLDGSRPWLPKRRAA
jgi:hypothetical protein